MNQMVLERWISMNRVCVCCWSHSNSSCVQFFKSPLSSFRRTWSIRRRSSSGVKRTGSGTVFDWTHE